MIAIITRTHCQGAGMGRAFVIVRPTAVTIRDALRQLQASKPQPGNSDLKSRAGRGFPPSTWYSAPRSTTSRRRRRSRRSQLAHRSGKPASCPTAPRRPKRLRAPANIRSDETRPIIYHPETTTPRFYLLCGACDEGYYVRYWRRADDPPSPLLGDATFSAAESAPRWRRRYVRVNNGMGKGGGCIIPLTPRN